MRFFTRFATETSYGFIPAEGAVALRLARSDRVGRGPYLGGPALSQDMHPFDGLNRVLSISVSPPPDLIFAQGTGPHEADRLELAAIRRSVDLRAPLISPLVHFGHTLGASGLLSVALAVLAQGRTETLPVFSMPADFTMDGRPMGNGASGHAGILVLCRALNGACAAATICDRRAAPPAPRPALEFQPPVNPDPLMHATLRSIAGEALRHRPEAPPDLLVARLDAPLAPSAEARIGGRLLPSAVLEITPSFVAQLIARCWGFAGPALCLVGDEGADPAADQLLGACRDSGLRVRLVRLRGTGDRRDVEWNA